LCTAAGFAVADLAVHHLGDHDDAVAVQLELRGPGSLTGLASELGPSTASWRSAART
jgi:hypothetical protein